MQIKWILCICFAISALNFGCNRKYIKQPVPDIFAPEVSISTPKEGASYNSLFPIHIVGTITDTKLDSLEVLVFNKKNQDLLLKAYPDVKGKTGYTINEKFTSNVSNATPVPCLCVINCKDFAGNKRTDSVNFFIYKP